jgi:2-polyprenyl-3-methyl-5-hydroxy-6-metoxy-1,4-benzoquinol methylase
MHSLLQLPRKVAGYFFFDDSYEKYYTSRLWDRMYQGGYSLDIPLEEGRYAAVTDLVRQYAGGGVILDAGCGDGLLEGKCCSLSVKIVGIDYSHTAIAKARQRHLENCEFICADVRRFFSDQCFSVIVFNESLYYVEGCSESLQAMTAFLDQNGVFIISMYDTRITRRIWESLRHDFSLMTEVRITHRVSWTIRVLRPHWASVDQYAILGHSQYS